VKRRRSHRGATTIRTPYLFTATRCEETPFTPRGDDHPHAVPVHSDAL